MKSTKQKKLKKDIREIASTIADTKRIIKRIQNSFHSNLGGGWHPWTPDDGVIMDGKKQPDLVEGMSLEKLERATRHLDTTPEPGEDSYALGNKKVHAVNGVVTARQTMEAAGEAPWSPGFSHTKWKDGQKRQEVLYAFSKLSLWQKILLFIYPSKFKETLK
jgi:hypothetical protein